MSSTLVADAGITTSAVNKELSTTDNSASAMVTVAVRDSDDDVSVTEMDVDTTDNTLQDDSKDDKPTTTMTQTASALPEAIELSTVDTELNLDDGDGDDWLASLLKYDDDCTDTSS